MHGYAHRQRWRVSSWQGLLGRRPDWGIDPHPRSAGVRKGSCCGRGSRNWASRLVAEGILRAEKRKVLGIGGRPAAHWEDTREPNTRSACARSSRRCWCNGPRRTPVLGAHLVATCPEVRAQNHRAEGARPHPQGAPVEGGEDLAGRLGVRGGVRGDRGRDGRSHLRREKDAVLIARLTAQLR
jgi:hypothetical protein